MANKHVLLNKSYLVAGFQNVAYVGGRIEFPLLLTVKSRRLYSARDTVAADLKQLVERTLYAVVYALYQSGSEFYRKRYSRAVYLVAGSDAAGLFVYLYGRLVAAELDNLSYKVIGAYAHDVVHFAVRHSARNYERSGNFNYGSHEYSLK